MWEVPLEVRNVRGCLWRKHEDALEGVSPRRRHYRESITGGVRGAITGRVLQAV